MTIREFEVLTGFHPSLALYDVIEQDYNSSQLDKYEYCEQYKADKGGMAERPARIADKLAWEQNDEADKRIAQLLKQLEEVKEQLNNELDWQPAKDIGTNMSEREYQLLADDTPPMSELDAIRRITQECGFDMACIELVPTVETFDKNKYGKCRVSGSYSRLPVWASTDWNYIRFQVCGNQWEIVNGELMAIYD